MTDFDTELRLMLRERAGDIASLPADFADLASLDVLDTDPIHDLRRPNRSAWLIAAVVAAVLAVVGTAVAIRSAGNDRSIAPAVQRSGCAATLPAPWRAVVAHGSTYTARSALPVAISSDGRTILVSRDFGTVRDVAVLGADKRIRPIYTVPQPDKNRVEHATVDGRYAAIDVERLPRGANGVDGSVIKVVLVDLTTGIAKQLDAVTEQQYAHAAKVIPVSGVSGSHVYWVVQSDPASGRGAVEDYDIATGAIRTFPNDVAVTRGGPPALPAGIVVGRPLPHAVSAALTTAKARSSLVTDGSSYAWVVGDRRIGSWSPSEHRVAVITLPAGVRAAVDAVAGPFVLYEDVVSNRYSGRVLLDTRTGATAELPGIDLVVLAGGGHLVATSDSAVSSVVDMDTATLPGLHC